MASLKEVKNRIASVKNTRKITSAMKMVASSKLHHACLAIERMRPYESQLKQILQRFIVASEGQIYTPFAQQREVKNVALVLITSNSSLCGAFNSNAIKAFHKKIESYRERHIHIPTVVAIGKKAAEAVRKAGFKDVIDNATLLEHPSYAAAADIASSLMMAYTAQSIDKVDLIYHHFKSASSQILQQDVYLPLDLSKHHRQENDASSNHTLDYIIEPNAQTIAKKLIPLSLHLSLFTAVLDSVASEHAARVIAMQTATDNADDLLQELNLTYNKTRQQAITAELLDIVGGSMK